MVTPPLPPPPPPPRNSTPDPFEDEDYFSDDHRPSTTPTEPLPSTTQGLTQRRMDPDLNPNPNSTPNPHQDCRGGAYHLYIDFNKAFNSVPRGALFKALRRYGFPEALVQALAHLYSCPSEFPIVNGRTLACYPLTRGLRQGCPLSPILFNLYLNLVLFSLPPHLGTSFSYIDDILFRLSRQQDAIDIFNYFDADVRLLGLDMNPTKSEVQALEGAPHFSFTSTSGSFVSTLDPQGKPRDFYRYLGVYLYTENQLPRVIEFISAEIRAYFGALAPLGLTQTELIRLTNCQLVSILTDGLMAQVVDAPTLRRFDA